MVLRNVCVSWLWPRTPKKVAFIRNVYNRLKVWTGNLERGKRNGHRVGREEHGEAACEGDWDEETSTESTRREAYVKCIGMQFAHLSPSVGLYLGEGSARRRP